MPSIVMFALLAADSAMAAGITYHGRLMSPDGSPVTSSSVQFRIQIRTPGGENCLLYEEQQVKDLSALKGVFALNINDGSAQVVNTEPFTLDRAFQNRGTFTFGGGKCSGALSYAPNPTDGRRLVVDFNDGSFGGWEAMPAQFINHVPMALESVTVGGFSIDGLMRVVNVLGEPASVLPFTETQYNALLDLASGSGSISGGQISNASVTDAKIDTVSGAKVTGNISGNAAGFTGSLAGDVTGAQGATVVSRIQGRAVDAAAPSHGQALVWSTANSRWEPGTVSGGSSDWSALTNIPATFAPSAHSHPINEITSGSGAYFNYSPNGVACAAGGVLKWDAGGGGRWICGTDVSGGGGSITVTGAGAITVDSTDPENPVVSASDASTAVKGVVQLASSTDTTAGLVVQADDSRLTDSRVPLGAAGGELTGNYPSPNVVASTTATNNSLVRRDGSGNIAGNSADFSSLSLTNGTSTITLSTPAAFTTYSTKLPASAGTNGQILTSNGTDMVWANANSLTAGNVSGTVAIAHGGTGATSASAARTNLGITATGDALATAADAAAARTAISAMVNVAPGANGNVLTSNGTTWTSAPFAVNAANVGSSAGGYFTYKPNNGACANGEVLKWETAGGGRWACGTDISSTGGTGVASVSATAPVTVDNADPNNPRVEIDDATTSSTGVVQLATASDTAANLVVQANDTRLSDARTPTGAAGGDLAGTFPNPTIAKLQTKDITLASLASGDVLKYDGTKWVNAPPTDGDTLGGMSCASGDVALYNGSTWTCVNASVSSANNAIVRRNGSGQIQSASANFGSLQLNNGGGSTITVQAPAAFTSYTLKLPSGAGSSGQILTSNGSDMVWANASGITAGNVSGTVAIANGGTGATSASAARTNLGATATGTSLFTATDAAAARAAISAMTAVTPGTSGNVLQSNGTSWVSGAVPSDSTKVSKTGDTMSGTLTLPSNGLVVGTNQLIVTGGNVGVGTSTASEKLQVQGNVLVSGRLVAGAATDADALSAITLDFTNTNMIRATGASGACGTLNFTNVTAGGSYTVTIPNATAMCTALQLNGSATNVKKPSGYGSGGVTSAGVVYTAIYDGTNLWVSYVPF